MRHPDLLEAQYVLLLPEAGLVSQDPAPQLWSVYHFWTVCVRTNLQSSPFTWDPGDERLSFQPCESF